MALFTISPYDPLDCLCGGRHEPCAVALAHHALVDAALADPRCVSARAATLAAGAVHDAHPGDEAAETAWLNAWAADDAIFAQVCAELRAARVRQ